MSIQHFIKKLVHFIIFLNLCSVLSGCAGQAFKKAQEINTVDAYDSFLNNYGNSEFAQKAFLLKEKLFFQNSEKENTPESYNKYLKEYPNGKFVEDAKVQMEKAYFEHAMQINTAESYKRYLKNFPNGKYVSEAINAKELALYKYALGKNNIDLYNNYLKEYPKGKFIEDVKKAKEKAWFKRAKLENTPESYDRYINEYKKGTYVNACIELKNKTIIQDLYKDPLMLIDTIQWTKQGWGGYFRPVYDSINGIVWAWPTVEKDHELKAINGKGEIFKFKHVYNEYGKKMFVNSNYIIRDSIKGMMVLQQYGWRLPTKHEIQKHYPLVSEHKKYNKSSLRKSTFACTDENDKYRHCGFYFDGGLYFEKYTSNSTLNLVVVRDKDEYTDIIYNSNIKLTDKISMISKLIMNDIIQFKKNTIPFPELPAKPKYQKLEKKEFEKISDFNKRVEEEKQNFKNAKKEWLKETRMLTEQHRQKLKQYNEKYNKMIEDYKKQEVLKKIAENAIQRAIVMLIGYPFIKEIKYNTEKGAFNIILSSTLNEDFLKSFKIKVPIDKAPDFKKHILNEKIIPVITIKLEGNNHINAVDIDTKINPKKMLDYYQFARNSNTVGAYDFFLKEYPDNPYIDTIERSIKRIQKNKNDPVKSEREKYQALYTKKKQIGNKVCTEEGIVGVTISAYVTDIRGKKIKLRINDTKGETVRYNGNYINVGSSLWDYYSNWRLCD